MKISIYKYILLFILFKILIVFFFIYDKIAVEKLIQGDKMEFNIFNKEQNHIKQIILIIGVLICIIIAGFLVYLYNTNARVRNFLDFYVLRKEVAYENLPSISIDSDKNQYVYTFDKYIIIGNKYGIKGYVKDKQEFDLDIKINNPIMNSMGKYLIIAEKNGSEVYCIQNKKILWQNKVDGEISKVYINKNGYAVIIFKQGSYKSIVRVIKNDGNELFTNHIASSYIQDVSISTDNKLLAMVEVDTSKVKIESNVRVVSIDKTISDNSISTVYTYNIDSGNVVSDIKFIDKEKILCMTDSQIYLLQNGNKQQITDIDSKNTFFASIDLNGDIIKAQRISAGLFGSEIELKIIDTNSRKELIYELEGNIKSIKTNENVIAVNLGTEVYFINTSAWLLKKYVTNAQIKDVFLYDGGSIIEYRNKIEIINY